MTVSKHITRTGRCVRLTKYQEGVRENSAGLDFCPAGPLKGGSCSLLERSQGVALSDKDELRPVSATSQEALNA